MSTLDRQRFIERTVDWINRALAPEGVTVDAETLLFADGLIDSIRILRLIAWTEHALSVRIPDRMIRMDYFRTVRHIADRFLPLSAERGDGDVAA